VSPPRSAVALDTNVVVAALLVWHKHHDRAFRALDQLVERKRRVLLPLPALLEAYSVMTRLPAPHRLEASDALALLEGSLLETCDLVALDAGEGWDLLRWLRDSSVQGGRAYDGQILACARKGGATEILTFNGRDFAALDSGIEVREP
jgi:predicted nucleic acid-binding protein